MAHRRASPRARRLRSFVRARSAGLRISVSSAGVSRIRFDGLARRLSARDSGHPNEIAFGIYGTDPALARAAPLPRARDSGPLARTRPPEARMVPFFVQIKCQLGKSYEVANKLADAEIASEVYSTAGEFDLLVKFYVDDKIDIGHFVNEKVQCIPGIQDTRTIITFKAF
jgi:DNA-binding Lrp family transcriptional regulator